MLEFVNAIWLRAKALVRRRGLERDLDEELAFHLEMRAQKYGSDRAAIRQFGNPASIRERCRELWTFAALETLWQDLRYAARTLAKTPAFSIVAVLSLALGIGANAALFSLVDTMLLRALPVRNPQELVEFVRADPGGSQMTNLPYAVFEYFRRDRGALADVFAIVPRMSRCGPAAGRNRPWLTKFPAPSSPLWASPPSWDVPSGRMTIAPPRRIALRSSATDFGPGGSGEIRRYSAPQCDCPVSASPSSASCRRRSSGWIAKGLRICGCLSQQTRSGSTLGAGPVAAGHFPSRASAELAPLFQQALESIGDGFGAFSRTRKAFLAQKLLVNRATEGTSGVRWNYWEYSSTLKS